MRCILKRADCKGSNREPGQDRQPGHPSGQMQRDHSSEQEEEKAKAEKRKAEEKSERGNDVANISFEVERPALAKPGFVPAQHSRSSLHLWVQGAA